MHFGFTMFLKQKKKKKKKMAQKETEENQNSVTVMISVDQKGTVFSSEVEIRRRIVWIKILKREFQKSSNECDWDKLPD